MTIKFLCMLFGAALVGESVATPGLQIFSSMIGGALFGWNAMGLFLGEVE